MRYSTLPFLYEGDIQAADQDLRGVRGRSPDLERLVEVTRWKNKLARLQSWHLNALNSCEASDVPVKVLPW